MIWAKVVPHLFPLPLVSVLAVLYFPEIVLRFLHHFSLSFSSSLFFLHERSRGSQVAGETGAYQSIANHQPPPLPKIGRPFGGGSVFFGPARSGLFLPQGSPQTHSTTPHKSPSLSCTRATNYYILRSTTNIIRQKKFLLPSLPSFLPSLRIHSAQFSSAHLSSTPPSRASRRCVM
jgi:hypothetical protein